MSSHWEITDELFILRKRLMNKYLHGREETLKSCMESIKIPHVSEPIYLDRIHHILLRLIKSIFLQIPRYVVLIVRYWGQIRHTSALRGRNGEEVCIVLGHGPSLEYMDAVTLKGLQNNGIKVVTINYWSALSISAYVVPDILVISDPATLEGLLDSDDPSVVERFSGAGRELRDYLENAETEIWCPLQSVTKIKKIFPNHQIHGFVDLGGKWMWRTIDITLPRAYTSATIFKALAVCKHLNFRQLYILGVDFTYPHDIFCDEKNRILRVDRHAFSPNRIFDFSAQYTGMNVWAQSVFELFNDLHRFFGNIKVTNLDPYSLVDTYPKMSVSEFLRQNPSGKKL